MRSVTGPGSASTVRIPFGLGERVGLCGREGSGEEVELWVGAGLLAAIVGPEVRVHAVAASVSMMTNTATHRNGGYSSRPFPPIVRPSVKR